MTISCSKATLTRLRLNGFDFIADLRTLGTLRLRAEGRIACSCLNDSKGYKGIDLILPLAYSILHTPCGVVQYAIFALRTVVDQRRFVRRDGRSRTSADQKRTGKEFLHLVS